MKINISDLEDRLGEAVPFEFVTNAQELDAQTQTYSFEGDIIIKG